MIRKKKQGMFIKIILNINKTYFVNRTLLCFKMKLKLHQKESIVNLWLN